MLLANQMQFNVEHFMFLAKNCCLEYAKQCKFCGNRSRAGSMAFNGESSNFQKENSS